MVAAGFSGANSFDFITEYYDRIMLVYKNSDLDAEMEPEVFNIQYFDATMQAAEIAHDYWVLKN